MMLLHSETNDANLDHQEVDQVGIQQLFDTAVVFDHLDLDVEMQKLRPDWDDLQRKNSGQINYVLTLVADEGDSMGFRLEYSHNRYAGLNNLPGLCACVTL